METKMKYDKKEINEMKSESITLQKIDIAMPPRYKVVFMNDDVTPMGFVVSVLELFFQYTEEKANEVMLKIHNEGSAIVGTYNYSVAETKKTLTDKMSKQYGFPLVVKVEKDS
jgi:ATP-dependent Clp protease adaptor protein ClpS